MMGGLLLQAGIWLAATPTPSPTSGPSDDAVTPGVVGFTVTFLIAIAAVLLILAFQPHVIDHGVVRWLEVTLSNHTSDKNERVCPNESRCRTQDSSGVSSSAGHDARSCVLHQDELDSRREFVTRGG